MKNELLKTQTFTILGNGKLFVAPTHAHDLVVVEGSVFGGRTMLPPTLDVVPDLVATLLDAGTAKKKKDVLREFLAGRGISISFGTIADRTTFFGQCFPEDLQLLLSIISECLGEATFPESEVANAKKLALGQLAEMKSDTRTLAGRALEALIYDTAHVNYSRPIQAVEKSITSVRRSHLQEFRKKLGKGGLVLVVAGDVTADSAKKAAEKAFGKLGVGTEAAPDKKRNTKTQSAAEKLIPVADKANIDVVMGMTLPLTLHDKLFHPMKVLVEMLGGGFTSHLMHTIRERDGLTYGIYASLAGFNPGADGYLKIWATFSPDRYAESVAKLREELDNFFTKEITETNLSKRKEEMVGSYLVSLSTTHGLAKMLHTIGTAEFDPSYLTEYPNIINAVSLRDIKDAADLISRDTLALAASGTFKKA